MRLIVVLLLGIALPVSAMEVRILPQDESGRDLELQAFEKQLEAAVDQRNAAQLMSLVSNEISVSSKRAGGVKIFEKTWHPESRNSDLWPTLAQILKLGGGFLRSERGVKYCAPYTFVDFPSNLDIYGHVIVIQNNVPLKGHPSLNSVTITNLSYNVLRVEDWRSVADENNEAVRWLKVKTLGGQGGYVEKKDVRSPTDYSACFLHEDSTGWKLVSLTSNE